MSFDACIIEGRDLTHPTTYDHTSGSSLCAASLSQVSMPIPVPTGSEITKRARQCIWRATQRSDSVMIARSFGHTI